jgi:hypothetical protein
VIREALNYPPSGEHGSRAVFVGGLCFTILTVIGFVSWYLLQGEPSVVFISVGVAALWLASEDVSIALIVVTISSLCVQIVLRGYYVAVLRASTGEINPVAPSFRGRQIVTDGIKSVIILFVYFFPVVMLGSFGLSIQLLSDPGTGATVINTVGAFAFLFGLFAFIASAYLVPAAITLFARKNSLRAAFDLSTVRDCVLTEDYAVGWVLATLMLLVFTPITLLLQFVLVGFFLQFYLHVSVYTMYALAVTSALDLTAEDMNERNTTTEEENTVPSTDRLVALQREYPDR